MSSRTRSRRVPATNAVVARAAAAFGCVGDVAAVVGAAVVGTGALPMGCAGAATVSVAPVVAKTTVVTRAGAPPLMSVGQSCRPTGLETCFNAIDDNCDGLVDEGCGLASGLLQIVIAWPEADADVDLEVIDPRGEPAQVGRVTESGLTKDRDCPGDGDDCGGQNFEVVTSNGDELPLGRYRVTLLLEHPPRDAESVHVRIGGHIGQDGVSGEVELSPRRPRISIELQRSVPGRSVPGH